MATMDSQEAFLRQGGIYAPILKKLEDAGLIDAQYVYREYPKMLYISEGFQDIETPWEDVKGRTGVHVVRKEVFREVIVSSEDEEERVLSGGKTSTQLEDERQGLLRRAQAAGVKADPSWSAVRLRRELGEKMDAPEAPKDDLGALKAKLAQLEEMAAMKAKIEALEAQLAMPNEKAELQSQLTELGVKVDQRWSVTRLREELASHG